MKGGIVTGLVLDFPLQEQGREDVTLQEEEEEQQQQLEEGLAGASSSEQARSLMTG